ncbi:MAG: nicotinate (nicotinamide) nucleotide adenylyltransferase [Salibacteraceae bacterium]
MAKQVGLYFGTFNPIHVGHLIIADHMAQYTDVEQVWFVVSPQNPMKPKATLLADHHRLALVRTAIEDNPRLRVSTIEFDLPRPSYTINTLVALKEKHPDYDFWLIMGQDNLATLHKWKAYREILENYKLLVYPRIGTDDVSTEDIAQCELNDHPSVHIIDAPLMKISASFIRKAISEGKDVRYLLTERVEHYVKEMHFYKKPIQ